MGIVALRPLNIYATQTPRTTENEKGKYATEEGKQANENTTTNTAYSMQKLKVSLIINGRRAAGEILNERNKTSRENITRYEGIGCSCFVLRRQRASSIAVVVVKQYKLNKAKNKQIYTPV